MSDAYLKSDGVNDYVQLASPVIVDANQAYRLEIDFQALDGGDFGVRLFGNLGNDNSRLIAWKGNNANIGYITGTRPTVLNNNILKRQTFTIYRTNAVTHELDIDGVNIPTFAADNGSGLNFDVLLTQNSVTNARNPVNLYGVRLYIEGVLTNNWMPSASNGSGDILYDTVGGNHGTLINFATDGSQWGVGALTTDVTLTVGPSGDYANIEAAVAAIPTNLVTANERYIIEVEDIGTDWTPVNGTEIAISGITTDVTRNIIIQAKAGHEYNPATNTGVRIKSTTNPFFRTVTLNCQYTVLKNIKVESASGSPSYALGAAGAYSRSENCYLKARHSAGSKALIPTGRDFVAVNCILVGGEFGADFGNWTYDATLINCTIIDPLTFAVRRGESGCTPVIINTLHYGTGAMASASGAWDAASNNNATSEVDPVDTFGGALITGVTSDVLVDYAGGDYRIALDSAMDLAGIGAFFEEGGGTSEFSSIITSTTLLPTSLISLDKLNPEYSTIINSMALLPSGAVSLDTLPPEYSIGVVSNTLLPVSSITLNNELPSNSLIVTSESLLPTSSVLLDNILPEYSASIVSNTLLPVSSLSLDNIVPEYSISLSSNTLLPTSSVNLDNDTPSNSVSIFSLTPLPTSSVLLNNINPSGVIISSSTLLPTSNVMLDAELNNSTSINSNTLLPIGVMTLSSDLPELSARILSNAPLPTSIIVLSNGSVTYYIGKGNLVTIKPKNNIVTIKQKSNFVQLRK